MQKGRVNVREIKFRAWHKADEKMYEVYGFTTNKWLLRGKNFPMPNGAVESMQFTGLKDKKGKEIYEGDILYRTVHLYMYGEGYLGDSEDTVKVEYREDYAGFFVGERPLFAEINATTDFYTQCKCTKYEVIGNIYENPEVLEGEFK